MTDRYLYDAWGNPIRFHYDEMTDQTTLQTTQDCEPILENNKRLQTADDGWSPSRFMRRKASVPIHLCETWAQQAGIEPIRFWTMPKAEQNEFLRRHIRDSDWRHVRTVDGNL